jgi:hypothetical protein
MLGVRELRKRGGVMVDAAVDRQKRPRVGLLATPIDKAITFGCMLRTP